MASACTGRWRRSSSRARRTPCGPRPVRRRRRSRPNEPTRRPGPPARRRRRRSRGFPRPGRKNARSPEAGETRRRPCPSPGCARPATRLRSAEGRGVPLYPAPRGSRRSRRMRVRRSAAPRAPRRRAPATVAPRPRVSRRARTRAQSGTGCARRRRRDSRRTRGRTGRAEAGGEACGASSLQRKGCAAFSRLAPPAQSPELREGEPTSEGRPAAVGNAGLGRR